MTDYMKEAFETWFKHQIWGNEDFKTCLSEAWQAALLAHIQRGVPEGWKEATIAWEVCASIHREYAKKKDPFFTTRQSDFVRHAEAARAAMLAAAPAPAEVPMPQGYVERPSDYTGDIWIESQMRTYGAACRAAGEAAGYARGVRGERDECAALCRNIYSWPGAYYAGPMDTATLKAAASAIEARSGPKVGKRAALRGEVKP